MERDTFPFTIAGETLNFNSHAHVERDLGGNSTNSFRGISTHTLTWSVTNRFVHIISRKGISTHTLTWSVTKTEIHIANEINISTHTLTWSVT